MKSIKEWFNNLSPKAKKMVIYLAAVMIVLGFCLNSYKSRTATQTPSKDKTEAVSMEKNLLQKTELAEERRQVEILRNKLDEVTKRQQDLMDRFNSDSKNSKARQQSQETNTTLPKIPTSTEIEQSRIPPPPGQIAGPHATGIPSGTPQNRMQPTEKKTIGEIAVISNPAKTEEKKKPERTVYLPPSFMSAILLTGLDAATSNNGKSNPDPLLLRVQTPAVLPNDVKANLAGCFVVAEGQGRLDKERVDVRLVSLSCLTKEGSAVIDSKIKGFVTDADAKTGLAGHMVSRMGASTARALIAGMLAGAGEMIKMESTSVSTSGLGSVSTVNPSKVGTYALGSGLASGTQSLAEFYLTLARQATPVVEANAGKHVTVVISEGQQLVIKDLKQQDDGLTTNEDY